MCLQILNHHDHWRHGLKYINSNLNLCQLFFEQIQDGLSYMFQDDESTTLKHTLSHFSYNGVPPTSSEARWRVSSGETPSSSLAISSKLGRRTSTSIPKNLVISKVLQFSNLNCLLTILQFSTSRGSTCPNWVGHLQLQQPMHFGSQNMPLL